MRSIKFIEFLTLNHCKKAMEHYIWCMARRWIMIHITLVYCSRATCSLMLFSRSANDVAIIEWLWRKMSSNSYHGIAYIGAQVIYVLLLRKKELRLFCWRTCWWWCGSPFFTCNPMKQEKNVKENFFIERPSSYGQLTDFFLILCLILLPYQCPRFYDSIFSY